MMVSLRFRFVVEDVDRYGNVRTYFRRKGQAKIRLPGMPGSAEFMEAYRNALATIAGGPSKLQGAARGSFRCVCIAYYASASFKGLDASTQAWRRRALDEISQTHGDKPVARMEPQHVRKLRDEKADLPGASRSRLKALRALFRWAVEAGEALHDPTRDVKALAHVTQGHHSWTVEEVSKFEACHPVGTKARLAMAIMLYTACRREDAVRLGPQHVRVGRIRFRQAKNEHRKPVDVDIPVHPDLAAVIESTKSGHLTFLVTQYGRPFSTAGFGNKFREWCDEAGLTHCSAHGLRKATATRLAESGASSQEIMAITGHQSLEEVERYTRAATRSRMADSGMSKFKR